jgi:hypothetical protein
VNFLPFAVAVTPTFLQLSPAFTAAIAFIGTRNSAKAMNEPSHLLHMKRLKQDGPNL